LNWYLLQTKPNAHTIACKHLKQQGFEVFLPLIIRTSKKGQKFVDSTNPLFPGYLFMGSSRDPVPWKTVNSTRGVCKAVTLDGMHRPISTLVIEGLKLRCNRSGIIREMNKIEPGDRVKIDKGPFADFICKVEEISDRSRVWVMINLLNQQTRAEISMHNLSKLY